MLHLNHILTHLDNPKLPSSSSRPPLPALSPSSLPQVCDHLPHLLQLLLRLIVQAAWTRRSRSEAAKRPNRESWKQRTDTHMRPFLLNVFFYRKLIADRSMEADVYAVSYKPRKGERIKGKLGIVLIPLRNMALFLFLDSLLQNICVTKKGLCFVSLMFIPKLVSKNLTRDVGESRVSEGALSDQLLSHSFSICSMKMSCLVSLTCSFVPFDTSLTRLTHSIIISSPIVNKLSVCSCLRLIVQAAWTRRSRSEAAKRPNRESWKQRTDTHMRPFLLNVFFYRKLIADRSMEADVYAVSYKPRKGERIEGKLGIVLIPLRNMALFLFLDSLLQNICVTKKGLCFVSLMFIPKLV
ncbi:hypothetical protein HID58_067103, partial [Brassica napus]